MGIAFIAESSLQEVHNSCSITMGGYNQTLLNSQWKIVLQHFLRRSFFRSLQIVLRPDQCVCEIGECSTSNYWAHRQSLSFTHLVHDVLRQCYSYDAERYWRLSLSTSLFKDKHYNSTRICVKVHSSMLCTADPSHSLLLPFIESKGSIIVKSHNCQVCGRS